MTSKNQRGTGYSKNGGHTFSGLAQGTNGRQPFDSTFDFNKLLPSQRANLLAQGLFVKDPLVEGGYRITEKGKLMLKELET